MGATDGGGMLAFGDTDDADIGRIFYYHVDDSMSFTAGTNAVMKLKADSVVVNEDSDDVDFRVESNGKTHAIFVDAGNDHVCINTSDDLGGDLNVDGGIVVQNGSNLPQLTLISTDQDATSGPVIKLFRNSSSPADSDDVGKILFTAENDASEAIDYATIRGDLLDVTDGTEDGIIKVETITAGSNLEMARFGDGVGVVLNESGNSSIDFRVESDNYAHCLFVDGGNDRVGVGEDSDIGGLFRISLGDSGVTGVDASGQGLVIEDNANAGLTIATPTNANGSINFADSGDNNKGFISYHHATDDMFFSVNGNGSAYSLGLFDGGQVSTGGETAPDGGDGGLCLDQNANDVSILTLKSSDIAHGMTDNGETDTYFFMKKGNPTEGGVYMQGFSESASPGVRITGATTSASQTEATNTEGSINLEGSLKSGNSIDAHGADDNILIVRNHGTTNFIVKGDGELFSNQSATVGTYDAYEDAQLVRAFDLNHMQGVINSKFDKFVQYNKDDLVKARLIGKDENGNATSFVNWTGMSRLHNGAIWQQYEKTQRLTQAMYKLATKTLGKEEADKLLDEEEIKLLN
jgi:hypothetical protein